MLVTPRKPSGLMWTDGAAWLGAAVANAGVMALTPPTEPRIVAALVATLNASIVIALTALLRRRAKRARTYAPASPCRLFRRVERRIPHLLRSPRQHRDRRRHRPDPALERARECRGCAADAGRARARGSSRGHPPASVTGALRRRAQMAIGRQWHQRARRARAEGRRADRRCRRGRSVPVTYGSRRQRGSASSASGGTRPGASCRLLPRSARATARRSRARSKGGWPPRARACRSSRRGVDLCSAVRQQLPYDPVLYWYLTRQLVLEHYLAGRRICRTGTPESLKSFARRTAAASVSSATRCCC